MRIVLSYESFEGFAGSETYTLTVARELDRLGHDVAIYSPRRRPMAEYARRQGVRVLGADDLPRSCDVVISSDAATCHELAGRYADAVRMVVVHSADFMLQAPPQLADRCQAVVVMNDRVRRAVQARAWHPRVVRLHQPIELLRFGKVRAPPVGPRAALVLSNYLEGPRAAMIREACRASGLRVDWVGSPTAQTATPELAMAGVHMVIGLGRSVLEAMASGRAAYVYGVVGADGWVTAEHYAAMEADGFAGTSMPELVVDGDRLAEDLRNWEEAMGEVNRDLAHTRHSAREHAVELVKLARELGTPAPAEPALTEELAHLVRVERQSQGQADAGLAEVARLHAVIAERDALIADRDREAVSLRAQLAEAGERFEGVVRTRRWRLAGALAAPLDRLRSRRNGSGP